MSERILPASVDHPIIDFDRKLIFFWTPRCGSTTLLIWFFHLIGWGARLRTASAHQVRRMWLEEHQSRLERLKVFYADPAYRRIVVGRNPYSRIVSSYYLILNSKSDSQWASVKERRPDADDQSRLTFREFLSFLETEDLATCNIHWRLQSAKDWWTMRLTDVEVIHSESLSEELSRLSRTFDVRPVIKQASSTPRYEGSVDNLDVSNLTRPEWEQALGRDPRTGKMYFPEPQAFLSPDNASRISRIYAEDFRALHFPLLGS